MPCEVRRQFSGGNLIYDQENFLKYSSDGFHPVSLGDKFCDGRYTIHHKLGFGAFATVWLAKDEQRNRWVAVKILRASFSRLSQEHQNLLALAECAENDNTSLGSLSVVQLLHHFVHEGPNGSHGCLVFPLLGPSVNSVVDACRKAGQREQIRYHEFLRPSTILKISRQLLKAVAFMHKSDYAHGDITAKNLAFTSSCISKLGREDFFKIIGEPKTEVLTRRDGKSLSRGLPTQLVEAARWPKWMDEEQEDIRLIDFGGAFHRQSQQPAHLNQPAEFRAPETFLTEKFDWTVDLWSIGITIYFLVFGCVPFYSGGGTALLVAQMINFVEDLPAEWRSSWEALRNRDNDSSNIRKCTGSKSYLEQKFYENVHDKSLKTLLSVMQSLLRFRPSDRISAAEALEMVTPRRSQRNTRTSGLQPAK